MATLIKNNDIENLLSLLATDNVISKKKTRYDNKTQILKQDRNVMQFLRVEGKLKIIEFDYYGNKQREFYINNEEEFPLYLHLISNEKLFFHKKRVSKKSLDSSILDEEASKKIIYSWLLKRYSNDIILPEISLGSKRVDYLMLSKNNIMTVEIKSEVDTLDRLESQVKEYIKYSNIVYIAAHTNKIDKISKLDIDDRVGIIELKNNKMKIIKKPIKIKNNYLSFKSFISYQDFLDMKIGFKGHSKVDKMDIEYLLEHAFTNKQTNDYIYALLVSRYKKESELRKEEFTNKSYKKALGSADKLGINRLSSTYVINGLKFFFNLDNEFLVKYIEKEKNKSIKVIKSIKYSELIVNERLMYLNICMLLKIPYTSDSSVLNRYVNIINNKDLFIQYNSEISKYISLIEKELLNKIVNAEGRLFLSSSNKITTEYISNILKREKIDFEVSKNLEKAILLSADIVILETNKYISYFNLKGVKEVNVFKSMRDISIPL